MILHCLTSSAFYIKQQLRIDKYLISLNCVVLHSLCLSPCHQDHSVDPTPPHTPFLSFSQSLLQFLPTHCFLVGCSLSKFYCLEHFECLLALQTDVCETVFYILRNEHCSALQHLLCVWFHSAPESMALSYYSPSLFTGLTWRSILLEPLCENAVTVRVCVNQWMYRGENAKCFPKQPGQLSEAG